MKLVSSVSTTVKLVIVCLYNSEAGNGDSTTVKLVIVCLYNSEAGNSVMQKSLVTIGT